MHTNLTKIIYLFFIFPTLAFAGEGKTTFHSFTLETDIGESRDGTIYSWDFDGWIGGDINKLWFKSEGEKVNSKQAEQAEFWAMYSRNISTFWDAQIGIRFDEQPASTTYLIAGMAGLAPHFFEIEAHLFISEEADITARIRQERDFLITQRLITEPYVELNLSAQNIPEQEISSGITDGEFGIQTRYEITRKFAPYIDIRYERKFGGTSTIAKRENENRDDFITNIGLRLMF